MNKLTVLYGHQTDTAVFEEYYTNTHLPVVATMQDFEPYKIKN
jgi:uncharacterized protein (TIGR02118 family)